MIVHDLCDCSYVHSTRRIAVSLFSSEGLNHRQHHQLSISQNVSAKVSNFLAL